MKLWPQICFLLAATSSAALADSFPKADQALKEVDTHVKQLDDEFAKVPADLTSKPWVKAKLAHMFDVDQFLRKYFDSPLRLPLSNPKEEDYLHHQVWDRSAKVDLANTTDLKAILAKYRWITIREFGLQADNQAWLLVQHADRDPPFQRSVLEILSTLYAKGDTSPQNYAYLFDRVAESFGDPAKKTLQRYGTQGKCTGPGTWEPHPTEDPKHLDERRKSVGLPPEAEYFKMFKDICK